MYHNFKEYIMASLFLLLYHYSCRIDDLIIVEMKIDVNIEFILLTQMLKMKLFLLILRKRKKKMMKTTVTLTQTLWRMNLQPYHQNQRTQTLYQKGQPNSLCHVMSHRWLQRVSYLSYLLPSFSFLC